MMTVMPLVISFTSRTTSQFAVRMQPWLALRPMVCGWFVPCTPMPARFNPIHITPTGLLGPMGSS